MCVCYILNTESHFHCKFYIVLHNSCDGNACVMWQYGIEIDIRRFQRVFVCCLFNLYSEMFYLHSNLMLLVCVAIDVLLFGPDEWWGAHICLSSPKTQGKCSMQISKQAKQFPAGVLSNHIEYKVLLLTVTKFH